jgi:DNA-binding transcriptional ArsR family regulator
MVDARLFQALSDPTRLKILLLLSNSPMNVSSMVDQLKCAQPAVSRHLRVLRETSLIHDTRKGKEVEYSLNHDQLKNAKLYLEALGGGGGLAHGGGEPSRGESKKVRTGAGPGRRGKSGARKSRARTRREPEREEPKDEREATPGKQKTTSRVSSDEMPDFVVEREEEESMDDFLL